MRRPNFLAGFIAAVATFVLLSAFVHRPHRWHHGWGHHGWYSDDRYHHHHDDDDRNDRNYRYEDSLNNQ